ncbi:unnamed protein product [Rotaria socialis]|uniref:Coiled-coil and C2 domain-containing protein 2A n=1 Tax=Rotaria socialis TaxID=392032 RepID=A0A820P0P3_9BILA|nr:unnamed protein product [Rotaria socialis]CAF3283544.1 unnamed protein product [Rotaria socialis]CAF4248232.1 unnamed protein product [Rotaria socialis]CAF4397300.1 unnamed protein product [Rotaria socialis]CAF4526848.1 unnamed protein product [Rotaria socialis]
MIMCPFRIGEPPDNDFDTSSLQRCRDILYINVFDEIELDLPKTDRERDQIIRKRIVRNWLGSIKIPFSNIYINQRLEGNYCLSVPNPLIGYARIKLSQLRNNNQSKAVPPSTSVLRMFVTMEPLLATPEPMQQSFDSTESLDLLNHARSWVEQLNKKFPDREYKATVSDINGRAVFIPRFIHRLPLPPLVTTGSAEGDSQIQCQRLARFVSLIPFLADAITFPGICDIWETSDQFLRTMAGDDEEHAVLLNNYFLSLNRKTWIALGISIYSGPVWFVLTKEDSQRYPTCWNVSDGQNTSTIETWNPIRSIYLLANEENIWANIQEQDVPSRMNFDVSNTKHWRPFFDRSFPRNSLSWTSVQPNDLHYEVTQSQDVVTLEKHIFEVIRDKSPDWRASNITPWHYGCQKRLQEILKTKEESFILGLAPSGGDIEAELTEFQSTHDITGFSIQMPYSTIQAVVDTVYSTKLFEHATNDIQFALAVHVHAYPNNILAVWVYVAHLTRKTTL